LAHDRIRGTKRNTNWIRGGHISSLPFELYQELTTNIDRASCPQAASSQAASSREGKEREGGAFFRTDTPPKGAAIGILVEDKEMALLNTFLSQSGQGARHQRTAQTSTTVRGTYSKSVDEAATAVVSAKNGADEHLVVRGDKAETGVTPKESRDILE
jgi:hypothetical protein